MTQARLAKRIRRSQFIVHQIENEKRPPSPDELDDIAKALDVDVLELGFSVPAPTEQEQVSA